MSPDQKNALIKEEYFVLLKFYEDFDARFLTIKGWSITVGVAALALGLQYDKAPLFLFGSGVAALFWILEAVWKGLQHAYRPRISAIETAFRQNNLDQLSPLQTHTDWAAERKRVWFLGIRNMFRAIVFLPHIITFVAGIGLFYAKQKCWF